MLSGFARLASRSNSVMCSRLQGKVAVVTASTEGIGYAIAERLATEGAKVVLSSRKENNVSAAVTKLTQRGFDVSGIVCHVGNKKDREHMFEHTIKKYGGIDILVSNAAVNPAVGSVLDCPEDVWDKIFDINVKSAYMLSKEVQPHIIARGGGSIVYVSSIGGFQPFELLGAYSVSKTALLGLTKAASLDLAKNNIRVNCVAPGVIKTKFSSTLYETELGNEMILSQTPLRRLGIPSEVASVVAFLVSDDASYITGETIIPSGGMPSRL